MSIQDTSIDDLRSSWHFNVFANVSSLMRISGKSGEEVLALIEEFEKEVPPVNKKGRY